MMNASVFLAPTACWNLPARNCRAHWALITISPTITFINMMSQQATINFKTPLLPVGNLDHPVVIRRTPHLLDETQSFNTPMD